MRKRDDEAQHLYLRGGTYYTKFRLGGRQFRESLRTADLEEARTRLDTVMLRAQREHYGMTGASPGQWVYFMHDRDSGKIKVGTSTNVDNRFRSLKANTSGDIVLLGTVAGSSEMERLLHGFLAPFHYRREWFEAHPEVLQFVAGLVALDARRSSRQPREAAV